MEEVPLLLYEIFHLPMNWVCLDRSIMGFLARERFSTQSNNLLLGTNERESFRIGSSSDAEPIQEENRMGDQEKDRGHDLSITGEPSLFPVTKLSIDWGFRFVKYCGSSSLLTTSGSKEDDQVDPDFRSPLYGGRFLSYQARVGDAYASFLSIGFPSFSVSNDGDEGEAPNMFHPPPISIISDFNLLFLLLVHCIL
ncbi:hypothetical protein M9H77_31741 [Catharanthus roseus]|uniref:Uncharacterized protein n=1 Tax=Catharanthus roseus TaxID=4058 RepID=A0ACC0A304_CATRO|nr:hypothetical protein M9H77_31741 [Catharanthus roseus]